MKRTLKIFMLATALVALMLVAASCGGGSTTSGTPASSNATSVLTLPQQVSNGGKVSVTVSPVNISATAGTWTFKVNIDSQGPELNQDLAAAAVLVADNGPEHKASGYSGDPAGGTHRQGVLSFAAMSPLPRMLTLKLRGVGVGERSFSWMLGSGPRAAPAH